MRARVDGIRGPDGGARAHEYVTRRGLSREKSSCDTNAPHSEPKLHVVAKEAPFTLKQIRDAIPAHLFERSTVWSLFYLGRDVLFALLMWFIVAVRGVHVCCTVVAISDVMSPRQPAIDSVTSFALRVVLWNVFAAVQGIILTGVWVCAHECGHSAFSASETVNNVVGLVAHSFLLVPYFSWKFTHAAHHGATNHISKDQVFVPTKKDDVTPAYNKQLELLEDMARRLVFVCVCGRIC